MICKTQWERDNAISKVNTAGAQPVSFYLSDIKAWAVEEENTVMAIAREQDVIKWASDRGIFEHSSPDKQLEKTAEELREVADELIAKAKAMDEGDHEAYRIARGNLCKEIGDVMVTMILQAHFHGLTAGECLEAAYQKIKDRKGEMRDGLYVKEA